MSGLLFHDEPFAQTPTSFYSSGWLSLIALNLLVCRGDGGTYRVIVAGEEPARRFTNEGIGALDGVSSDFRLAAFDARTGVGRIYYRRLEAGLFFSSDLRFLLRLQFRRQATLSPNSLAVP